MLWAILFGGIFILGIAGIFYLFSRVKRFSCLAKLSQKNRAFGWLASALAVLLPLAVSWVTIGYMNAIIILMQLNYLFQLSGDDNIYGLTHRENTDYIVTSGISDWAIKFKTGCRSEYAIINVEGK